MDGYMNGSGRKNRRSYRWIPKFPDQKCWILEKFPIFISGRIDIISLDSNRFYRYDDTYFR